MMTRDAVLALCKQYAPNYTVDPILALALCEQESSYDETAVRLENGFFHYTAGSGIPKFSVPTRVLMSTSYGLTQMMGESLRQVGFFGGATMGNDVIVKLEAYIVHPEWQIDFGLKFFNGVKHQDLLRWNGGGDPDYPAKVLARRDKLLTIYGGTQ
jgi:hypothetical protein